MVEAGVACVVGDCGMIWFDSCVRTESIVGAVAPNEYMYSAHLRSRS